MAEKMLVTQALDERDLLIKKIADKIEKASFVDTVKPNEDKVYEGRISREEFRQNAESAWQQIQDLISRYQKIDAAIVASNAAARITTSQGEYTVAGAISLRARLKNNNFRLSSTDFEGALQKKLSKEYADRLQYAEERNRSLQQTADSMRMSILGRDGKAKDDKPLEVVDTYIRENTTELADPIGVQERIAFLKERREALMAELDTQIKVSNATTFITF